MNHRRSLFASAALFACGVAAGTALDRPSAGQAPAVPPALADDTRPAGPYRVAIGGGGSPYLVVIDTRTGRCWERSAGARMEWRDLGPPTAAKK